MTKINVEGGRKELGGEIKTDIWNIDEIMKWN